MQIIARDYVKNPLTKQELIVWAKKGSRAARKQLRELHEAVEASKKIPLDDKIRY